MLRWLGTLFLTLFSVQVWAAQCSAVFPGAVQSNGDGGRLTINPGGQILNSPTTSLPFDNATINGNGNSCGSAKCSVSGEHAASFDLPAFPSDFYFNGPSLSFNKNRTLGQGNYYSDSFSYLNINAGRTKFSSNYSTYYIRSLNLNQEAKVNLRPGTYWIKTLTLNGDSKINVVGDGSVKVYVQNLNLNTNARLNGIGDNAQLLMTVYNNMHANTSATAEGVFYVANTLTLDGSAKITGAVSALNLTINSNGKVEYNSNIVAQTDFGALCRAGGNSLIAKYAMEQTAWGGSGSILDTSGNNNNATPIGGVSTQYVDPQKSCKAAYIPANSSHHEQDAIDTGVDINSLGDQGSIAFWYRSQKDWWDTSSSKILFDASQSDNREFTLYQSESQRLYVYISNANGDTGIYSTNSVFNFGSTDWVHIAFTWDADNNEVSIYVNGRYYSLYQHNYVQLSSGLADIGTLYMGDNRSASTITYEGDAADGYIDEVQLFDYALTSSQVVDVSDDVTSCALPGPELIAKYELSELEFAGNNSILDTSGNNNHASPVGNIASILPSPQISCRAVDIPRNTDNSRDAIDTGLDLDSQIGDKGTIAFWYKSDSNWTGGQDRKLMDASKTGSHYNYSKAFYGTLTSSGRIEFGLEGYYDRNLVVTTPVLNFSADQWVHIAFTWNVTDQDVEIYINGNKQSLSYVENQGISPPLTDLDTLYIGDNRSDYADFFENTNRSADGSFDEIHIYNGVVDNTTINSIMGDTSRCLIPDIFYTFDECSYSNNPFEIKDTQGNVDATPVNNIDTQDDAQVGRALELNGYDHHAQTNIEINDSWSVSTWFKTPFNIDSGSRYHVLGSFGGDDDAQDLLVLDNQDNFRWQMYDDNSVSGNYRFGNLADGWHHMALVAHNGVTKLYINGSQVDSISKHPKGLLTLLGTSTDSLGDEDAQGWRAPLDEFLLFKYEISTLDIEGIYQNQLAGKNYDGADRALVDCACNLNGLTASYFNGYTNSNADFPTGTPSLSRVDNNVAFDWGYGSPDAAINNNDFAVVWQGTVQAPITGNFYFGTYTDDGVRLWVNGDLLINDWRDKPPHRVTASSVHLTAGQKYSIRMEYYENGGGAVAQLEWQYPGQGRQAIPSQYLRPVCSQSQLDHYRLEYPAKGYTCAATDLVIKACANGDCSNLYTGSASLSLATDNGSWVGDGSVSFTNGLASKQLRNTVDGSVSTISAPVRTPNAPFQCYTGNTISDCKITYSKVGLTVSWGNTLDANIPNQLAQKAFADKLVIQGASGGACSADLSGNKLKIAVECVDPGSCRSQTFNVDGSSTGNDPTALYELSAASFNASGIVELPVDEFALRYDDAGQIKLKVEDSSGEYQGESNTFVVTPAYFELSTSTNADISTATGETTKGDVAGKSFTLSLDAKGYLGNITKNYRPGEVQASLLMTAPTAGVSAALRLEGSDTSVSIDSNSSANYQNVNSSLLGFSDGSSATVLAEFPEVGTYTLDFKDNNYFATQFGTSANVNSGPVNYAREMRFKPAYFSVTGPVSAPALNNTCAAGVNEFSYIGQVLNYGIVPSISISAMNHKGSLTQNYADSLWSISPTLNATNTSKNDYSITDQTYTGNINSVHKVELSATDVFDGTGVYTFTNDGSKPLSLQYVKDIHTPHVPFDTNILIEYQDSFFLDGDAVCYRTDYGQQNSQCAAFQQNINTDAKLRYGRMNLLNAVGSSTSELPVPIQVEYYAAGGFWEVNTLDACTNYNSSNASRSNINFSSSTLPEIKDTGNNNFVSGQPTYPANGIVLNKPDNAEHKGSIRVKYAIPSDLEHLKMGSDDIEALVTFGQFRGSDRVIHWREVFNE